MILPLLRLFCVPARGEDFAGPCLAQVSIFWLPVCYVPMFATVGPFTTLALGVGPFITVDLGGALL